MNDIDVARQDVHERFVQLPKVVQDAINSADVEAHLRSLAETHKLHIDQWQVMENEVMLTLLGFQSTANLAANIKKEVGVSDETANELAAAISTVVFEPIRAELERELDHPAATSGNTAMSDMTTAAIAEAAPASPPTTPSAPAVAPATPPPTPPTEKAVRGSIAETYVATPSHERKTVEGDPYREQLS